MKQQKTPHLRIWLIAIVLTLVVDAVVTPVIEVTIHRFLNQPLRWYLLNIVFFAVAQYLSYVWDIHKDNLAFLMRMKWFK